MSIPDALASIGRAITAAELADLLSLNKLTIYRLAKRGKIPSFRIANCVRFDPRAVAEYLRKHSIGAA